MKKSFLVLSLSMALLNVSQASIELGSGASADGGIAIGDGSKSGFLATAIGDWAQAIGEQSLAIGTGAQANAPVSVAIGTSSITQYDDGTVVLNGERMTIQEFNRGVQSGEIEVSNDDNVEIISEVSFGYSSGNLKLNRKLTSVAEGELSVDSKEAINGSQLFETNQNLKNIGDEVTDIGDRVTVNEDNIEKLGDRVTVNEGNIAQNTNDIKNLGDQVTNIDDRVTVNEGNIEKLGDRVTVNEGNIAQNTNDIKNLGDQVTNIDDRVTVNEGNITQNTANINNIADYFGGGAYVNKEGDLVAPEYILGSTSFNNVGDSLTYLNNKISTENLFQVDGDQIVISDSDATNAVTTVNFGNRVVAGVANGKVEAGSTEAVNGGQLHEVQVQVEENSRSITHLNNTFNHYTYQTNARLNAIEKKVHENRKVSSAGISGAMAMSSIPYSMDSSKVSLGLGVASYDGESAFALGFQGNMTDRSKFRIQFSYDSQNRVGVGAGMAIEF